MKPRIIDGGSFSDNRGGIRFVNDCNIAEMVRFYILENSDSFRIRAWQGHKLDNKYFYCLQGSFRISYIKVDDWENPSKDLIPESTILTSEKSQALYTPAGYANSIESLEPGSKLMCFSSIHIDKSKDDMVRYPQDMWLDASYGKQ